jgi:hypothetical protein
MLYTLGALSCSFILAQTGEPMDPKGWQAQGWIIAGIFALIGSANQGMALWDRLFPRKNPPDHEVYASKNELAEVKRAHKMETDRIEKRFSEWLTQQAEQHDEEMQIMREWRDAFGDWQLSIERALGKVETKADVAIHKH